MEVRNNFQIIEQEANLLTVSSTYKQNRIKKRKIQFGESNANDVDLVGRENFRIETFNVICDKLITEISTRRTIYKDTLNNFQIFFDHSMTNQDINE